MEPYIGEIRAFAGNFAPAGWHVCAGSLISISEYDALYALLGTTYGGDGQNTFGLPDLRGRIVVGRGTSQGITYNLGNIGGVETVTLTGNNLPVHNHPFNVNSQPGTLTTAAGNFLAAPVDPNTPPQSVRLYMPQNANGFAEHPLLPGTIGPAGGSQPHENRMPYLTINYIISLLGIFPSGN